MSSSSVYSMYACDMAIDSSEQPLQLPQPSSQPYSHLLQDLALLDLLDFKLMLQQLCGDGLFDD